MAILVFEHHPCETTARIGQVLRDDGHRLVVCQPYEGQALPADLDGVDGLVVMGGPQNVDQQDKYPYLTREIELIREAHERAVPVVGVCLGAQLIAAALGGQVAAMDEQEIGWRPVRLTFPGTTDPIMAGVAWNVVQFHCHGQHVVKLPPGGVLLASSQQCKVQAFKVGLRTYGFQYHSEWTRTDIETICGRQLAPEGVDTRPILEQGPTYYPRYRQFGDRVAGNLSLLLFPLDKRVAHRNRPVENFRSA